MEKHITELYCDRCERKFERRESQYGNTLTMAIGWFKLQNGSGSKNSSNGTGRSCIMKNLDHDLCADCTKEFGEWWKNSN